MMFFIFLILGDALKTLDPVMFGKWSHYLGLKSAVYESYVSYNLLTNAINFSIYYMQLYMFISTSYAITMFIHDSPQAYCFYGKELLEQEKCGDSIRVLRHAQACEWPCQYLSVL